MSISQNDKIIKSGTELCGWEHHGGPNQQFRLEGQHLVSNLHGRELVLDIQGGSQMPGTPVILWHNERTQRNQMWRLDYERDDDSSSSSDSDSDLEERQAGMEEELERKKLQVQDNIYFRIIRFEI